MKPRPRRLPAHHQLVYEIVRAQPAGRHVAAGDIHRAARALEPSLGCSTVYRALRRLVDLGLVAERRIPGMNATLFEAAPAGLMRLVCAACGRPIPPAPGPAGSAAGPPEPAALGRCAGCRDG